jgi:hypothetical protein
MKAGGNAGWAGTRALEEQQIDDLPDRIYLSARRSTSWRSSCSPQSKSILASRHQIVTAAPCSFLLSREQLMARRDGQVPRQAGATGPLAGWRECP